MKFNAMNLCLTFAILAVGLSCLLSPTDWSGKYRTAKAEAKQTQLKFLKWKIHRDSTQGRREIHSPDVLLER